MRVDYVEIQQKKNNAVRMYDEYVSRYGTPSEDTLMTLPTMVIVGYFLTVHSRDPQSVINRFLRNNIITYRKANEVKMLVSILSKEV